MRLWFKRFNKCFLFLNKIKVIKFVFLLEIAEFGVEVTRGRVVSRMSNFALVLKGVKI